MGRICNVFTDKKRHNSIENVRSYEKLSKGDKIQYNVDQLSSLDVRRKEALRVTNRYEVLSNTSSDDDTDVNTLSEYLTKSIRSAAEEVNHSKIQSRTIKIQKK